MAYKSQKVLKAEYKKARRNLQQNVRRLAKRGYDVSDIVIPAIPEGKMKQSYINQLNKLNIQRYELSSKIELVKHRDITGEYVETLERVSGKRARGFERRRAGSRAAFTRKENVKAQIERERIDKRAQEKNEFIKEKGRKNFEEYYYGTQYDVDYSDDELYIENFDDYVDTGLPKIKEPEGPYYDEYTGKVIDPIKGELKESDVDFSKYSYYMDTETGEIIETNKGAKRPKVEGAEFVRIMSTEDAGKLAYKRAIEELNIMSSYMGDPKHGKNLKHDERVRANADQIKAKLEALHGENPGAVERALSYTNSSGDFHSVDFMYRAGGYGAYLYYFESLLESLGADMDYESEEDYDEGNFEY